MKTPLLFTSILLLAACDVEKTAVVKPAVVTAPASSSTAIKPAVLECAIDAPVSSSTSSAKVTLVVSGWAFNHQTNNSENKIEIQVASTERQEMKTVFATLNVKRPDVATYMKTPKAELSGFTAQISGNSLMPGRYNITVLQNVAGSKIACAQSSVVIITE